MCSVRVRCWSYNAVASALVSLCWCCPTHPPTHRFEWMKAQVADVRARRTAGGADADAASPPFVANADAASNTVVVGLSCVQGGGKTTLVNALQDLMRHARSTSSGRSRSSSSNIFEHTPLQCVVMSMDDVYLTHTDQVAVAASHPTNELLQVRGTFGTHDTGLAVATLEAMRTAGPGTHVPVPRYDKSAFKGEWVGGPVFGCLVISVGWLVGWLVGSIGR